MKKRTILSSIIILSLIILIAGFNITTENSYRKIAWEALDKNTKQYFSVSWQNAKVEDITMDHEFGILPLDKSSNFIDIKGKEVKVVTFFTGDKLRGDVIIYIDAKTKKAIGKAPFM